MQSDYPPTTLKHQGRWLNLFSLYVNKKLIQFSKHYCAWWGIKDMDMRVHYLPFGLLVKVYSDFPEQEAHGTMIARKMGLPVPRIFLYGESEDGSESSILMTCIPGVRLEDVIESYSPEELAVVLKEIGECLSKIRSFPSPYGEAICGPWGEDIHNRYVPMYMLERQRNSDEFYAQLYKAADRRMPAELMETAKTLQGRSHRIVFCHADLTPPNILVKDGHLTGIIDWEYSGWYPEYWGFVLPVKVQNRPTWRNWNLPGGERYGAEKDGWVALNMLIASTTIHGR